MCIVSQLVTNCYTELNVATKIVNDVSYVYTVINISDTYNSNISIIGFSYKSFAIQNWLGRREYLPNITNNTDN